MTTLTQEDLDLFGKLLSSISEIHGTRGAWPSSFTIKFQAPTNPDDFIVQLSPLLKKAGQHAVFMASNAAYLDSSALGIRLNSIISGRFKTLCAAYVDHQLNTLGKDCGGFRQFQTINSTQMDNFRIALGVATGQDPSSFQKTDPDSGRATIDFTRESSPQSSQSYFLIPKHLIKAPKIAEDRLDKSTPSQRLLAGSNEDKSDDDSNNTVFFRRPQDGPNGP